MCTVACPKPSLACMTLSPATILGGSQVTLSSAYMAKTVCFSVEFASKTNPNLSSVLV